MIKLGCKVIGISAVSFHIILHVIILIIVQMDLDAVCPSSILLMSLNRTQTHKGHSALMSFEKERSFRNVNDKTIYGSI